MNEGYHNNEGKVMEQKLLKAKKYESTNSVVDSHYHQGLKMYKTHSNKTDFKEMCISRILTQLICEKAR